MMERRRDCDGVRVERKRPVGQGEGDWMAENISEERDSRRAKSAADHMAAVWMYFGQSGLIEIGCFAP
jgi:hypothetical protein